MIGRLAFRSLTAHPVRSAVLAAGFGVGVGVMAILLGVAAIVLEQAESPALVGGGDVLIRLGPHVPARLVLSGTLQSESLRRRVRVAAPFHTTDLYLHQDGGTTRVFARGGIPSLEHALDDRETRELPAWTDSPADTRWKEASPASVLRSIDRFHAIPDAPAWTNSWAEWLYFNGRASDARFYLTFLVGPRATGGQRVASVRLQLERHGVMRTYASSAMISADEAMRAPELTIGTSSVRLEGLQYRVHLDVRGQTDAQRVIGDLTLTASAGRLVPPLEIHGARGWLTGYVVPVMSGPLDGVLTVSGTRAGVESPPQTTAPNGTRQTRRTEPDLRDFRGGNLRSSYRRVPDRNDATGEVVSLAGGVGYHDHNWGFWQGVSWQWGQVQHEDLSFIYGRVFPPREAADPERFPGFVGALGPDGPLGYATNVQITETNDAAGQPQAIAISARSASLDLTLRFTVGSSVTSPMAQGPLASSVDFLQLRGNYSVSGRAAEREINFSAPGSAETFRGAR